MSNLIRIALLTFALGVLAAPLLDRSGALEEFAFALAEDASDQGAYLALTQFAHSSDILGNGPSPQFAGITNFTEGATAFLPAPHAPLASTAREFFSNRPLYLLYHNFLFYDCLA